MLTRLPHELVLKIASLLPQPDLVSLQRTNSLFLRLLTQAVWSTLVLAGHSSNSSARSRRRCWCYCSTGDWRVPSSSETSVAEFGPCLSASCFRRTLLTGQDERMTVRNGLLQPPHDNIFRLQLSFVRKAAFVHSFFVDNLIIAGESVGTGIARVTRFLRQFTGLKTITIILDSEYNQYYSKDYDDLSAYGKVICHPSLRFDIWYQPFLNAFPPERGVEFEIHRQNGDRWTHDDCLHTFFKFFDRGYRIPSLSLGSISNERLIALSTYAEDQSAYDERVDVLPEHLETAVRERQLRQLSLSFCEETFDLCHTIMQRSLEGLTTLRLANIPTCTLQIPSTVTELTISITPERPETLVDLRFPSESKLTRFLAQPRYHISAAYPAIMEISRATFDAIPRTITELGAWGLTSAYLPRLSTLTNLHTLQLERANFPADDFAAILPHLPHLRTLFLVLGADDRQPFKLSKSFLSTYLFSPLAPPDRELVARFAAIVYDRRDPILQTPEVQRNPWGGWRYVRHVWEGSGWEALASWIDILQAVHEEHHERRRAYGRWREWGINFVGVLLSPPTFTCRREEKAQGEVGLYTDVEEGEWPRDIFGPEERGAYWALQ